MMRVAIADEAEADLNRIGQFIAFDSPNRAVSFLQELLLACQKLAHAPHGSSLLPGFEKAGIRRRPYGNYVILYRIMADSIEVIHVVHGARDYRAMLSEFE